MYVNILHFLICRDGGDDGGAGVNLYRYLLKYLVMIGFWKRFFWCIYIFCKHSFLYRYFFPGSLGKILIRAQDP